jgi:hypothetical protein
MYVCMHVCMSACMPIGLSLILKMCNGWGISSTEDRTTLPFLSVSDGRLYRFLCTLYACEDSLSVLEIAMLEIATSFVYTHVVSVHLSSLMISVHDIICVVRAAVWPVCRTYVEY